MNQIVSRSIERAGLADIAQAHRDGGLSPEQKEKLGTADLLALGALADALRRAEVGDVVRVHVGDPKEDAVLLPLPERSIDDDAGLHLLRDTAIARLTSAPGATVRVSFADVGIEIALVALGFGANELVGRIANRRGLPLAEGAKVGWGKRSTYVPAEVAKKQELSGHIRQAGRDPVFVLPNGSEETYGALGNVIEDEAYEEVRA